MWTMLILLGLSRHVNTMMKNKYSCWSFCMMSNPMQKVKEELSFGLNRPKKNQNNVSGRQHQDASTMASWLIQNMLINI